MAIYISAHKIANLINKVTIFFLISITQYGYMVNIITHTYTHTHITYTYEEIDTPNN